MGGILSGVRIARPNEGVDRAIRNKKGPAARGGCLRVAGPA